MRAVFWLGMVVVAATLLTWGVAGGHRGWSQTQIPEKSINPITEIEFTQYRDGFVPGLDFLAAGVAGGAVLMGVGHFFGRRQKKGGAGCVEGGD